MDEFKNNDNLENDINTQDTENTMNNDTAESESSDLFSFSSDEPESQRETDKSKDNVFRFSENGEYHFTSSPQSDEDSFQQPNKTEPESSQSHTENDPNYSQQNPYRNPYYQQQNTNSYNSQYQSNYSQRSYNNDTANYAEPKKPTKGSSKGKRFAAFALAILIILGSIGIGISIGQKNTDASPTGSVENQTTTSDSATLNITPTESQTSVETNEVSPGIAVAKKARSSVVGVVVYDAAGTLYGEGSGVVMGLNDAKNLTYIITCAHVISDSSISSCGIMLSDGTVYQAKIVGFDERTDIGVLSVTQTNLDAASFGDSSALEVGETVYAIGNPGGSEFYGSMTSGIVSALDRSISSTYTMSVIQHNAAISPGNSGGALVNSNGQVIGINSSKISATDYEGIGFAVPISVAQPVVENLIKYGYVPNRPKLGISYASVSNYWRYSAIVQSKGLPSGSVIIASISDDSSFKNTDVAVGDMITSVNGKKLDSANVLLDIIDKSSVGDELKLGICRIERSSGMGGSYKINQFDVTVKLVEDKGSNKSDSPEETTTQSFYDYYYGNGNGDNYNNFEDFFSQFFGNGN